MRSYGGLHIYIYFARKYGKWHIHTMYQLSLKLGKRAQNIYISTGKSFEEILGKENKDSNYNFLE